MTFNVPSVLSILSRHAFITCVLGALFAAGACAPADEPTEMADIAGAPGAEEVELGEVHFATSCSADVQPLLERGLALLHHMMYVQAEGVFLGAAALEENCAMAQWGLAMANFQPFWGSADVEAGRPFAEQAVAMEPPTEREQAYAQTALAYFAGEDLTLAERVRNWEAAMEDLHSRFPDDPEAATLFALAHLSVDPADRERQERSDEILRRVHAEMPRHPGAIHYAIHVHDVERLAEDGVPFARSYEEIAPTIPHALHMPSHIYVRLGEWDEVIDWNRQSADAALEHPSGDHVSMHYVHALDYLMYGYLQQGRDEEALSVLEELRMHDGFEPHFGSAYALAAIPARWYVERRDWEGARNLEVNVPDSFAWEDHPAAEAMTWFARGLAATRTGDTEGVASSLERLDELAESARLGDDYYWADQIEVQRRSIEAWAALMEGEAERGIEEMRHAVELAASMEKHPITPGDLQPAQELMGDLLVEVGRPAEALEWYEESLSVWPKRYHSLLGAARAAEEAGLEEVAADYYHELVELTDEADPDREGVLEARERATME